MLLLWRCRLQKSCKLALHLRVCVCTWTRACVCSDSRLEEMSVSATASFISAAYVQQASGEELWVISVSGKVHKAIFAKDTLRLDRTFATDLEHKHFVKVEHLFYCFMVSDADEPSSFSVNRRESQTRENWGHSHTNPPLACNTQPYTAQITPNIEHKYAPWCCHWPSTCPVAAASAGESIMDSDTVSTEPHMGPPW